MTIVMANDNCYEAATREQHPYAGGSSAWGKDL